MVRWAPINFFSKQFPSSILIQTSFNKKFLFFSVNFLTSEALSFSRPQFFLFLPVEAAHRDESLISLAAFKFSLLFLSSLCTIYLFEYPSLNERSPSQNRSIWSKQSYYFGEEGDLGLTNDCSSAVVMKIMILITLFNIFVLLVPFFSMFVLPFSRIMSKLSVRF